MNGHNDGSSKRLTAQEEEEPSQNKRIKNSPSPKKPPSLHSQLLLLQRIKDKYPSPSNTSIKVAKQWYAGWESYCLQLSLLRPPPVYVADDEDDYVLLPRLAVRYFQSW